MRWSVAVLAAGQGTRMRSDRPKVLHELAGRPLVDWVLDLALGRARGPDVVVVVGHGADAVREQVTCRGVVTVLQEPQLGTGDALRTVLPAVADAVDAVLVLSGDVPLLRPATLAAVADRLTADVAAVLLTARLGDGGSYGRVIRTPGGTVEAVVEARDADAATLAMTEVNVGVYAFRRPQLAAALAAITPDNSQGEYYLTDVVAELVRRGQQVAAVTMDDPQEMTGVNTRADLATVARILNHRVVAELLAAGVTVQDPLTTWVHPDCTVAGDAVLEPGVILRNGCRVGSGARIGANSVLDGVEVAPGEVVAPLTRRG